MSYGQQMAPMYPMMVDQDGQPVAPYMQMQMMPMAAASVSSHSTGSGMAMMQAMMMQQQAMPMYGVPEGEPSREHTKDSRTTLY